jgi:hypothetical protein
VGNLKEEIKLFNQMKDSGYVPDMIAYSIHELALCKQGTFQEANRLMHEIIEKV